MRTGSNIAQLYFYSRCGGFTTRSKPHTCYWLLWWRKTTLAVKIATELDFEYQSIDRDVRWLPGWIEREKHLQRAMISELVKRDRWVMDGSGASTFDIRLPRTELILWVRVPRYIALRGLTKRVLRNHGKVRPEMADGCHEKLPDFEFLSYIWNFEKKHAPLFMKNIERYGKCIPTAVLESHAEISTVLRGAFKT